MRVWAFSLTSQMTTRPNTAGRKEKLVSFIFFLFSIKYMIWIERTSVSCHYSFCAGELRGKVNVLKEGCDQL